MKKQSEVGAFHKDLDVYMRFFINRLHIDTTIIFSNILKIPNKMEICYQYKKITYYTNNILYFKNMIYFFMNMKVLIHCLRNIVICKRTNCNWNENIIVIIMYLLQVIIGLLWIEKNIMKIGENDFFDFPNYFDYYYLSSYPICCKFIIKCKKYILCHT